MGARRVQGRSQARPQPHGTPAHSHHHPHFFALSFRGPAHGYSSKSELNALRSFCHRCLADSRESPIGLTAASGERVFGARAYKSTKRTMMEKCVTCGTERVCAPVDEREGGKGINQVELSLLTGAGESQLPDVPPRATLAVDEQGAPLYRERAGDAVAFKTPKRERASEQEAAEAGEGRARQWHAGVFLPVPCPFHSRSARRRAASAVRAALPAEREAAGAMSVRQWVSDHLHDVIGYSDATIADFVLAVAKKAATRDALGAQLAATLPGGPQ